MTTGAAGSPAVVIIVSQGLSAVVPGVMGFFAATRTSYLLQTIDNEGRREMDAQINQAPRPNDNAQVSQPNAVKDMASVLGAILGVLMALSTIVGLVVDQPLIALGAAFAAAVLISIWTVYVRWANFLQAAAAWVLLITIALAVYIIWPKTMTVQGIVRDTADVPLDREKVVLSDRGNIKHEDETDAEGHYQFLDVPIGRYRMQAVGMDTEVEIKGLLVREVKQDFIVALPTTPSLSPTPMFTPTSSPTPTPTWTITPTVTPTFTMIPTPTPTPPPTIAITSPRAQVICPLAGTCSFSVTGTSSGIMCNPNLKSVIFIRPSGLDQWWPHWEFAVMSDGSWQGKAQIGAEPCQEAGHHFEIVAMVLDLDQARRVAAGSQSLPQEYVAQSNFVDLVTTYEPVPVDVGDSMRGQDEAGSRLTLSTKRTSVEIDYDLGTGSWVSVAVPLNLDMSCMEELGFSVTFSIEGTGKANSLEVKFEDVDGTTFGWIEPRTSVTENGKRIKIELPLDKFVFWWDGDGRDTEMNWQQVRNLVFAISKQADDEGGAGRMIISEVALTPPIVP